MEHSPAHGGHHKVSTTADAATSTKTHVDPVCGMKVAANPDKSREYGGQRYYFCSQGCVTKFRADPNRYLRAETPAADTAPAASVAAEAIYTCPMHPQVRQLGS